MILSFLLFSAAGNALDYYDEELLDEAFIGQCQDDIKEELIGTRIYTRLLLNSNSPHHLLICGMTQSAAEYHSRYYHNLEPN